MTLLYVSPHADDVVFSCAGALLAARDAGRRVVVCTVFTRSSDAEIEGQRKAEDIEALARAGAERIDLGFVDAPRRLGVGASFRALPLEATVEPRLAAEVSDAIAETAARVGAETIYLPLGVGGHVDHLTVFEAWRVVGARSRFYEERPYAFAPALRALRESDLVGATTIPSPSPAAIARELDEGGCGALGGTTADVVELAGRLGLARRPTSVRIRSRTLHYPLAKMEGALALIDGYRSQVAWLFDGSARATWQRCARSGSTWFEREHRLSE